MTEKKWLECTDPTPMLEFLRGKVSDRKMRLFALVCCRRVECLLQRDYVKGCLKAINVLEAHIDGLVSDRELQTAWNNTAADAMDAGCAVAHPAEADYYAVSYAANAVDYIRRPGVVLAVREAARAIAYQALSRNHNPTLDEIAIRYQRGRLEWDRVQWDNDEATVSNLPVYQNALELEQVNQCRLVREVFNNPFRRITIDPRWLTSTVIDLATSIYDESAFGRLPILADALIDAGCDCEEIISHCRSEGPHAKGCWVVDLLLGKQ